jgi:cyclopropane-fatty-acyl-phospholipid synthase
MAQRHDQEDPPVALTPVRPGPTAAEDRWIAAVRSVHGELARRTGITVSVRLWNGTELGDPAAPYRLVLKYPWSLRLLLRPPFDLWAGEAYIHGAIDLEGDPFEVMALGARLGEAALRGRDLVRLLRGVRRLPRPPRQPGTRRAALRGRMHSKTRDQLAISFHYDLPHAFFETFLDRSLVYSCAYFQDPAEPLEAAQERKLDLICRKLRLEPEMRMLDIGCGWGSLLLHAARKYGVRGVGVTLSRTQADAGRKRVVEAGLADRIDIRLQDYRDLETGGDARFDAIASIAMAEAVGPDQLPAYARTVNRLLADGGLFLNHCMVMGDPDLVRTGKERTFANAYVFPDGGLVPAWRMVRDIERAGFEVLDVEQLRPHYALTLREWVQRLEANHDRAVAAASELDYRIWRAFMSGSAVGFESRSMGVIHVLGHKPGPPGTDPPLGREWMRVV